MNNDVKEWYKQVVQTTAIMARNSNNDVFSAVLDFVDKLSDDGLFLILSASNNRLAGFAQGKSDFRSMAEAAMELDVDNAVETLDILHGTYKVIPNDDIKELLKLAAQSPGLLAGILARHG